MADLETAHATLDHGGVTGVLSNPMTTQDDLIVGGASGVPGRLGKGSDNQVLTVDPTTHHLVWATPSSGFSDPMTTRGDIIVRNASNVTARLGRGGAGTVLTSDGTDVSWQAAAGGAGGYKIDTVALDGTFGDDFDGASLNGRWSRHVQGSGEETYQQGPGASALRVTYSTGAAARYIYQAAPNNTNETWETSFAAWDVAGTGQMYGILMVDSSGNGVGVFPYDNSAGIYMAVIASHGYSSTGASAARTALFWKAGQRIWLRLRKATGLYAAAYSLNGETYSPEISFTPSAFTPARIGIGRFLGTDASDVVDWYRFNKTA